MKCIAHIDMDCFYAQVEAVRLGLDCRTTPYALVQWGNFIAVNYPARALGVTRFQGTPEDALQAYPTLRMSHIATYTMGSTQIGYPEHPRISTHKVALEPYREASRRIFDIIRRGPGVVVAKAGIDEAYVDVTEAARRELSALRTSGADGEMTPESVREASTKVIEDRTEEMSRWLAERGTTLEAVYDGPMRALKRRGDAAASGDGSRGFSVRTQATPEEDAEYTHNCLLLCAATRVVQRIRDRIYEELRYDCSAGIAHNKLLAKCISATHKPNQQTLLLPDGAASALFDMPFSRLRGFGGKFGDTVREVCGGVELCREAWLVPLARLRVLNEGSDIVTEENDSSRTSNYVFFTMRGVGSDAVQGPAPPTTVSTSKRFYTSPTSVAHLQAWLVVLAAELCHRYRDYSHLFDATSRTLTLRLSVLRTIRGGGGGGGSTTTTAIYKKQIALPDGDLQSEAIADLVTGELPVLMRHICEEEATRHKNPISSGDTPPLQYVELTVGGLRHLQEGNESGKQLTLTSLFAASSAKAQHKRQRSTHDDDDEALPRSVASKHVDLIITDEEEGEEKEVHTVSATNPPQRKGVTLLDMFAKASARHKCSPIIVLSDSSEGDEVPL